MDDLRAELLDAIELTLQGQWEAAHNLVQLHEDDSTAAWIHAVLHKIEGDHGNARYWYQRANQLGHLRDEPHAELAKIRDRLGWNK
ncbi:MAG: hypothetical protein U1F83_05065 [Verrucomicrobiota bacterium]